MTARLGTIFAVIAMLVLVFMGLRTSQLNARLSTAQTDLLIVEAERDGLTVTMAEAKSDFEAILNDSTSAMAQTVARLTAANARTATVTEVSVEAFGDTITALILPDSDDPGPQTDSISTVLKDGILDARVGCSIQTALCRWEYSLTLRGRLLHVTGADGRQFAVAESSDSRVTFSIPRLEWVPPGREAQPFFNTFDVGLGLSAGGSVALLGGTSAEAVGVAAGTFLIAKLARGIAHIFGG